MDGGAWWATVMGLQRVGHDWAISLSFLFYHSTSKFIKLCDIEKVI